MPKYRVEVAYRTKREGVCLGMTVEADDEDDAIEKGQKIALKGYPARKHAWTRCSLETTSS
jgi:hypothetical protein